jgi:hypothetical protein
VSNLKLPDPAFAASIAEVWPAIDEALGRRETISKPTMAGLDYYDKLRRDKNRENRLAKIKGRAHAQG